MGCSGLKKQLLGKRSINIILNLFLNLLTQFKSIFRNELQNESTYVTFILSSLALHAVEIYYNLI